MRDNRKRTIASASLVSIAMISAVLTLAPASLAQTQIQVLDREGPFERFIDVGKPGFSSGDEILETHPLLDPQDESEVGRDYARLKVLRVTRDGSDFDVIGDITLRLAEGDVAAYGAFRFSGFFAPGGVTMPVIGGTGAYVGAVGTVTFQATETEGEFLITIDLVSP